MVRSRGLNADGDVIVEALVEVDGTAVKWGHDDGAREIRRCKHVGQAMVLIIFVTQTLILLAVSMVILYIVGWL